MADGHNIEAPDYMRSFLKVPRSVLHELWPYDTELRMYLELLDRAAWVAGPRLVRGHGVVHLEAGEALYGRSEMATRCRTTEARIRTAQTRLAHLGFVASRSTNLGTIAKLRGYGEITEASPAEQPAESPAINQPLTNESPAINQRVASGSTTNVDLRSTRRLEGNKDKKGRRENAAGAADVLPFPAPLDPVHLLATTAAEAINSINGGAYKATSEAIRKDCQKLVKAKITPARLKAAILFVGVPWVGSIVEHRICPATLLQLKRVQSALDDIDAGNTPTPKINGARSGRYEAGDADHSADKESGHGF